MKLEVGMYVRYKNGIGKIVAKYVKGVLLDKGKGGYFRTESVDILKASHNIKKMLQVGDIITYEFPTGLGMLKYENVTILENLLDILKSTDEYKILSIVTKEQFESMSYKVEG